MVEYWKATNHPLYNLLQEHLHVSDEYPVENVHSLLRARTNEWDTPVEIQRKARQINDQKTPSAPLFYVLRATQAGDDEP